MEQKQTPKSKRSATRRSLQDVVSTRRWKLTKDDDIEWYKQGRERRLFIFPEGTNRKLPEAIVRAHNLGC